MQLRRLNQQGLERLSRHLEELRIGNRGDSPKYLLADDSASEAVLPDVTIEDREFVNRFEAAEYLDKKFVRATLPNLLTDVGVWAWLCVFYFDQLCPVREKGERKPGELARWIPEVTNFRRYYRHLLAGPYRIFEAHRDAPERAIALLCGPLHKPGEVVEQLAARQELVTNKGVIELATRLYYDPKAARLKRGSSSKVDGSPRRLADVCNQFDVTWDLYSMEVSELLGMLPREFEHFMTC